MYILHLHIHIHVHLHVHVHVHPCVCVNMMFEAVSRGRYIWTKLGLIKWPGKTAGAMSQSKCFFLDLFGIACERGSVWRPSEVPSLIAIPRRKGKPKTLRGFEVSKSQRLLGALGEKMRKE